MKNFGINLVDILKYQTGTPKNGILLLYNGPLYYGILELMKKDPEVYNKLQIAVAKSQNPHSEVVMYTDANGTLQSAPTGAGFVSGTDPIGVEVVAGAVLGKPLLWIGKSLGRGLKLIKKSTNTYTLDLINLLGSKKTPQGHKGLRSIFTLEFADYLENLGVQTSKLSDLDLRYLQHLREQSVEKSIPKQGRIVTIDSSPYTAKYTLYDEGSEIGLLDTYVNNKGLEIANIKSLNPSKKGVSVNLYDSALKYGKQVNNEGLISGKHLLSPEQTKHIWEKYYPNRKTINHSGRHEFNTGDYVDKTGSPTVINNGLVVDLNTPFQDINTKSINMFHPDMIDKTTWTLKNPDWSDPSIFKVGIPTILGLNVNYDLYNLE